MDEGTRQLEYYSTCPQSKDGPPDTYLQRVIDVARWSEEAGCRGILVYTDNGIVDPWLVAQVILQHTRTLEPLIAIQPIYMHPYTAAKQVASLAFLHDRPVALNMLAGGFKQDLVALNDDTPHDDRYLRTVEYTIIMRQLLQSTGPVTFEGRYYTVRNLRMTPPLPPHLFPHIFSSGSSDAGMDAARDMESVAVRYPRPPGEEDDVRGRSATGFGIRVGIIARATTEEAWAVATDRFPDNRQGQLKHKLAMKVSDSAWHQQLSARPVEPVSEPSPYWLGPFQNYQTFCPYLVGTYDCVADLVAGYIRSGYRSVILDIPTNGEELDHIRVVFDLATRATTATVV